VTQVVGHVLNSAARFQEMHRHGVAQAVHRSRLDAGRIGILVEQLLHLALLQGPLAAGKEVRPNVAPLPQIAAQEFGGVTL
jgi:hypothetical protein